MPGWRLASIATWCAIAEVRVAEEPLREHRWATLALAQYRCGRQADALRSLQPGPPDARRGARHRAGSRDRRPRASDPRPGRCLLATPEPPAIAEHCPYKGLAPYDVDDAEAFFGRRRRGRDCVERLRASPLLVVTGPSGCGKSSLARAGLVPALARAGHSVAVFVPGHDAEAAMAQALALVRRLTGARRRPVRGAVHPRRRVRRPGAVVLRPARRLRHRRRLRWC